MSHDGASAYAYSKHTAVGFGQIVEEVPESLHMYLKAYELDDGKYAVLLRESVREEFSGAMKLGISTMMASHNAHLQEFISKADKPPSTARESGQYQEFINAILASEIKIPIKPDWIVLPARRRRSA